LPPEVHLQTPPNLWPLDQLPAALEAGINDLGGIDTVDVINPAYPQPAPETLRQLLASLGWRLEPRTCVHRQWWPLLPAALRQRVEQCARLLASAPA
jgi:FO synthase subunit 1